MGKKLSSTFSCFSTLVKLFKKSGCIPNYFHSLYEKSKNNIKPIKNQQHAKFFILLWDYSTSVAFEQKHICKESTATVVSTLPFPVLTPDFSSCPSRKSSSLLLSHHCSTSYAAHLTFGVVLLFKGWSYLCQLLFCPYS
jgi:hypothetical protein